MSSVSPHLPAHHHAEPGTLARRLGFLGLVPFVAGALFVWLLGARPDDDSFFFVVRGLTAYAALIVSFLGGLHWGMLMWQSGSAAEEPALQQRALWVGIGYSLAGLIAVLMPPHAGLALIGFALIACYLIDRKLYPAMGTAGWLTLRFRLTVVASLSCFLAAAQI